MGKKKILIILISMMIFVAILIVVFNVLKNKNTNLTKTSDNYIQDSELHKENTNNQTHELSFLKNVDDLDDMDGKIIDIKYENSKLYISTSNKVFAYNKFDIEELINSPKNIESIHLIESRTIILKNTDNTYSLYFKDYKSSSTENSPVFKEIEEIKDIENVVYLEDDYGTRISLIKQYSDGFFVDSYDYNKDLKIESKKLKMPLYLVLGMNEIKEANNIKQIYRKVPFVLMAVLSDGSTYIAGAGYNFSSNEHNKLNMNGSGRENFINVEKIYADNVSKPLFEEIGDKENLYTYSRQATLKQNTDEQYKIKIPLPENYKTDDIKNVICNDKLMIQFNDNNIYISSKNNFSELLYNEDLSSLYKSGKIKKIEEDALDFYILMDDKCVYKLDI